MVGQVDLAIRHMRPQDPNPFVLQHFNEMHVPITSAQLTDETIVTSSRNATMKEEPETLWPCGIYRHK